MPAGKRESTYQNPDYKKASAAFSDITLKAIEDAKPNDPGVQPRPTVGVQYVAIPEFQDLGTKVSQDIAAAIAGRTTVKEALDKGQQLGRSGMTGLAGGDHLHFTMLVGGYPVNPVDWWSTQWMEDRLLRKIREASAR